LVVIKLHVERDGRLVLLPLSGSCLSVFLVKKLQCEQTKLIINNVFV